MDRSKHPSDQLTPLQRIDATIAEGESLIARQEAVIVRREISGMNTKRAVRFLELLRPVVENYKRMRARLIAKQR